MDHVLPKVTNEDLEEVGTKTASPTRACSRNEIGDTKEQTPGTSMLNCRKRRQEEGQGHDSRNPKSLRNEERADEAKGPVLKKEIEPSASQIEKTRKCTAHEDLNTEQNTSQGRMADCPTAIKTRKGLPSSSQGNFPDMFLKKVVTITNICTDRIRSPISGVRVTYDNLVWVIYFRNHVKLFSSSGDVLRSTDLDFWPFSYSCMTNGDLLVTHGNDCSPPKPTIELISREGNTRRIADLSAVVQFIWSILYQDERIYVIGENEKQKSKRYIIIQLEMNGEIERIYELKPNCVKIDHLISLHGQIFAMRYEKFGMLPLGTDYVSSVPVNKVHIERACSSGASVDNFGNVIVGSGSLLSNIIVIDPKLERKYKIYFEKPQSGPIRSTAVDQQNQLWIVTDDGNLYITKYLKDSAFDQQDDLSAI